MRRGGWDEVELDDEPDALLMVHPGWTNDRETLAFGIRETGWFPTSRTSFEAAENADLKWGWIGVTDESTLVICDSDGLAAGSGEIVTDVSQVTLARIRHDA
jgi:hypothetical protein